MSGRRSSSVEGTPAGTFGSGQRVDGLAPRDGTRVAAEQDRQRTLGLRDLRLDLRDLRRRSLVLRLRLGDGHLRSLPVLELELVEAHRFAVGAERALRDRKLLVQAAQRDVVGGNRAHQRQDHAAPGLVGGEHVRLRRLGKAPDASPEVDFPARAEQRLVGGLRIRIVRNHGDDSGVGDARLFPVRRVADLREERRAGLRDHREGLLDIGGRDLDAEVVGERGLDQPVEHRVAELFPPRGVRGFRHLRGLEAEGGRRVDLRSHVVRSHRAACKCQRGYAKDGTQCVQLKPDPRTECLPFMWGRLQAASRVRLKPDPRTERWLLMWGRLQVASRVRLKPDPRTERLPFMWGRLQAVGRVEAAHLNHPSPARAAGSPASSPPVAAEQGRPPPCPCPRRTDRTGRRAAARRASRAWSRRSCRR